MSDLTPNDIAILHKRLKSVDESLGCLAWFGLFIMLAFIGTCARIAT